MRELHTGNAAVLLDEMKDARERLDVVVAVDAEIGGTDAAALRDRRRFRQDQSRAANRPAAQVHEMPVVRKSVEARVLAHRRHHDPVAQETSRIVIRVSSIDMRAFSWDNANRAANERRE